MTQGIMVHAIMSFTSFSNLDIPAFMAHALKISEYYSFILIYLLYKSSHDRLPKKIREKEASGINTTACDENAPELELMKGNK
jgi:hypothetical protein